MKVIVAKSTMSDEQIAAIVHEAVRQYCISTGDDSIKEWKKCPQWQKDSAIDGVKSVRNNPNITSKQIHQKWLDHKIKDGWTYGEEKDEKAKTHPALLDYSKLPSQQKVKDDIFLGIVKTLIKV